MSGSWSYQGGPRPGLPSAPARTGAFGSVRSRYLLLWAFVGIAAVQGVALLFGGASEELLGILFYVPLVAWLAFIVHRHRINLAVPYRWPALGVLWLVVAGMFFVQLAFSLGTSQLTSLLLPWLTEAAEQSTVGQGNLILSLIAIVVLPAFVEETLFRFALLERFATKWSVWVAVIVQAVAFGILHADPLGAGAFGVVTALLYLRSGSLWPGILIHAANNFTALMAMRLIDDSGAVEPTTAETLTSALVMLAISAPFLVWFLVTWWPRKAPSGADPLTPYQRYEQVQGLPDRHFTWVGWSASPAHLHELNLVGGRAEVRVMGQQETLASLPLQRVAAAYPTFVAGGQAVVLVLHDGSWSMLQVAAGHPEANRELALAITDRVVASSSAKVSATPAAEGFAGSH